MGDHAVVRLDPDQDRKRYAVLDHEVDPAFHHVIEMGVERREYALHVVLGKFREPDRNHDQHDPRRGQPIELVGRIVDDRQRLQHADLVLGNVTLEHDVSGDVAN